jgi:hypothetical protein
VDVVAIPLDADALRSRVTPLPVNEHRSPRKPAVLVWHRTEELALGPLPARDAVVCRRLEERGPKASRGMEGVRSPPRAMST